MRRVILAGAVVTAAVALALAVGVSAAQAGTNGETPEVDVPITGVALDEASAAALAFTGAGRVTETEVGDEESLYEVEVTLDDGSQLDVQLDESFAVVGSKTESGTTD